MAERLHRMVAGEIVYLKPEEEAAVRAEWAADDAMRAAALRDAELAVKRTQASRAMMDKILLESAADPAAPSEVKDYLAAMSAR